MDKVVDRLLDVFRSLKGGSDGKKKRGALFAGLAAAVAFIVIGLLSFRAWKTGKKLAALQHEKDVNEEKAEQAKADAKIAESEAEKHVAQKKIEEIEQKIKVVDEALDEAKSIYDQTKETIEEIQTWDEFDKLTRG